MNLGVGIPLLVSEHIPKGREVVLQSENGLLGMGPPPPKGKEDPDILNAGKGFATVLPGSSFFDSSTSFAMIRGKHLDAAIVGAYQVSATGDLANWTTPGQKTGGIGGAADLAVGAKRLWVTMTHTTEDGRPKIVERCGFPLTAAGVVSRIYTDLAIVDVTGEGLTLRELAPGTTPEDVGARTQARLLRDERIEVTKLPG